MGITDFLSSAMEYLTTTEVAHAEAPEKDDEEEEGAEEKKDGDDEEKKDGDDEEKKDGDDEEKEDGGDDEEKTDGDDEEEEEEEEEDEPVDPKPALEEECAKSSQCRGYKHHFDECVERVMEHENAPEEDKKGHKEENCVEEFFHLQHCATACAAPKLFKQLK